VIAKVEQTEPYLSLLEGKGGCISTGKSIKRAEKLYEREFTNSCSYSVTFTYKFKKSGKWTDSAYTLAGGNSQYLPAGDEDSIKDIIEK
jgi:hypothetical protein